MSSTDPSGIRVGGEWSGCSELQNAIAEATKGAFVRYEVELQGSGDKTMIVDFSIKPVYDSDGNVRLLIAERPGYHRT